ncbi:MAG: hypothetical protein M1828_005038 [Chrysothrix sp. TS-e1954]|nr:MAG: hypothetical protein M1828_005038 [Chrysothrix sp. TS-e1954]
MLEEESIARARAQSLTAWKAKDARVQRLPTKYTPFDKPLPKIYPAPPSERNRCKEPLKTVQDSHIQFLDPDGSRRRFFDPDNPDSAKVGDILLVRLKGGDTFAGACLSIKKRGTDTAILLRNQLTRVAVEMWYKIFSPNVTGIEVVQRKAKRARRARLYYMRTPKHDLGSVDNIVRSYQRQRLALRTGGSKGRDANAGKRKHAKSK